MSDAGSTNLSNESPARSPPLSPSTTAVPPEPFTPGSQRPLSPQTALNILATQPDIDTTVRAIAYGLVATIHNRDVINHLQNEELVRKNELQAQELSRLTDMLAPFLDDPLIPEGFTENAGRVSTLIPIQAGFSRPAKWVKQREDGRVELLSGEDHKETPYVVELYASPSYQYDTPVEAIPSWFFHLLNGPTPTYHTLRSAIADLDKWETLAEVERYRSLDDQRRDLQNELDYISAELRLCEDRQQACRHRIEAARIPDEVGHLEGRAFPRSQLGRRRGPRKSAIRITEPGVSV